LSAKRCKYKHQKSAPTAQQSVQILSLLL